MNKSIAFFTLIVALAVAVPALGQKERAKTLFDKGVAGLQQKNYRSALEAFEEAYDISPHWAVLAHIGTCYANLNQPIKSIEILKQYLEDGGSSIPMDERNTAEEMIAAQKRKIGVLVLSVEKKGIEALVDGESIGVSPFEEKLLAPGSHEVAVVFGPSDIVKRHFTIDAGQEYLLRIEQEQYLRATPPPPEPTVREEPEEQRFEGAIDDADTVFTAPAPSDDEQGSLAPFIVALSLTGATLATAGVGWGFFTHYALSESNYDEHLTTLQQANPQFQEFTYEETCSARATPDKASTHYCNTEFNRREFADKADRWFIVGVAASGAAILTGTLAVLFYVNRDWFGGSDEQVAKAPGFSLAPYWNGAGERGLNLSVPF